MVDNAKAIRSAMRVVRSAHADGGAAKEEQAKRARERALVERQLREYVEQPQPVARRPLRSASLLAPVSREETLPPPPPAPPRPPEQRQQPQRQQPAQEPYGAPQATNEALPLPPPAPPGQRQRPGAYRSNLSAADIFNNHITHIESRNRQFDENGRLITSPAGAIGVSQLIPRYGEDFAKHARLPWDESRARTDEAYNRALGQGFYSHLHALYNGDPLRAAAAYNSGPGNVAKAVEQARRAGHNDYVRFLPPETQNYVSNLRNRLSQEPAPVAPSPAVSPPVEAPPIAPRPDFQMSDASRDARPSWMTGQSADTLRERGALPPEAAAGGAITAYHASPHDIDEFDLSKVNEGTKTRGHGIYFDERPGFADSMREGMGGHIYETDLHLDPQRTLHYNAGYHAQPMPVRAALQKVLPRFHLAKVYTGNLGGDHLVPKTPEQAQAYRDAGIQAVKYANPGAQGRGQTHGYVLLDDKAAKIKRKYAAGGPVRIANPITAYHGSPHEFEEFDPAHIGAGEGAQSYGHGMYFAGNEGVARRYRDKLAGGNDDIEVGGHFYSPHEIKAYGEDANELEKDLALHRGQLAEILKLYGNSNDAGDRANFTKHHTYRLGQIARLENLKKHPIPAIHPGHMYEVAIHAPDEHFLHWDKPLSEQHSHVRKALTKLGLPDYDEETSLADEKLLAALNGPANTSSPSHPANPTGKQIHGKLVEDLHLGRNPAKPFKQSHADIASRLLSAGIPGIKYLDQGSRGAGQGTHNYVVFDPRHVETVRRYAKGGLVYHGHIPGHFAAGGFEPPHMRQPPQIMADIRSVGNIPGRAADVSKAMTMRARQTLPEEVFRQTGVFAPVEPTPGSFSPPHEYLRAEIPDTDAGLTTKARAIISAKAHGTKAKLGDVLEHPELYQAYPHLANTDVHFEDLKPLLGGYYQPPVGTLSAKNLGKIALNSNRDPDRLRRVALHEAQHLIQELHGFPVGSSLAAVESDPTLRAEAEKRKQNILDKELTPYPFFGFLAHLIHLGNPENVNLSPEELQKLHQEYLFEHEYERKRPDTRSPMVDAATKIANFKTYQNVPGERESRAVEHRSEIYPSNLRNIHPREHYFDDFEAIKDQSQGLEGENLKFMKDFLSRSAADHSTHHATIRWRAEQAAKGAPYRSAGGSVDDALRISGHKDVDPISTALRISREHFDSGGFSQVVDPLALTRQQSKIYGSHALSNRSGVVVSPKPGTGTGPTISPEPGVQPDPNYEDYRSGWSFSTPNIIGSDMPPPYQAPIRVTPRIENIASRTHQLFRKKDFLDLIRDHAGIHSVTVKPTTGTWMGEAEPSFVIHGTDQHGNDMTPEQAAKLSKMLGFGMMQDAVVTTHHHPDITHGAPTLLIGTGSKLSNEQKQAILNSAKKHGRDLTFDPHDMHANFTHYGDDAEFPDFAGSVRAIADEAGMPHRLHAASNGDLHYAKDYLNGILQTGRSGERLPSGTPEPSDLFERLVRHVLVPHARAAASEGYRLSPNRVAEAYGLAPEKAEIIKRHLRPGKGVRSTVPIMLGQEDLDVIPTGANGKRTVDDVLYALQNRAASQGQIDPGDYTNEAKEAIAAPMAEEVANHVKTSSKSAIGWYDKALKGAKNKYSEIFPEITRDPHKNMLFDALMGITSQGNDVHSNSRYATRLYDLIRSSNKEPKEAIDDAVKKLYGSFGKQTRAIEQNLQKYNHLVSTNGAEVMRGLFNKKMTVGEWNKFLRTNKSLYGPDGKPLEVQGAKGQNVTGWMVFGPKIGSFINNLHGDYSTLTADLWYSRTWNRLLGHNFLHTPLQEARQYKDFKDALIAEYTRDKNNKTYEGKDSGKPWNHGNDISQDMPREEFDSLIGDPQSMLKLAEQLHEKYYKSGYKEKSDLRNRAKNWIENRENAVEAPRGDKEREFQQQTAERAQEVLKRKYGMNISIADIQAALWFNEKELFQKLGVAGERAVPADYLDAAARTIELYKSGDLHKSIAETKDRTKKKAYGGEISRNNVVDAALRIASQYKPRGRP